MLSRLFIAALWSTVALKRSVKYLQEGLNQCYGTNLALNSEVDQDTFGKVTKDDKHDIQEVSPFPAGEHKAKKKTP